MANATAIEGVHFLTQSPVRIRILELLYENEEMLKHDLKDRVDAARVTVRRNVDALEERDLIVATGQTRELTPLGEVVVEDVLPAVRVADVVERLRPFIRWFPEDDLEFDLRALADAKIVVSDTSDPYAPVNRHLEVMQTATQFRWLLPAVGLQPIMIARDCVVEDGTDHEMVVDEAVAETLRAESAYQSVVSDLLSADNCRLFVAGEIAYYLGLCETCVQIGVEDNSGLPRALVETDATDVREWAERSYDQYRRQATPFTP